MYVLPEVRNDMRNLWVLLRTRLERAGLDGLPPEPEFDDPLAGGTVPDDLLMLQYCGFPYVTRWRAEGRLTPFACLHYDAPHCEGGMHRSTIVVRADDAAQGIADLRGRRAAINGYDSNTGMNLLRHAIAPYAEEGRFFSGVVETGAHVDSLRAVADGRADVAAIDCVTFAYIGDHMPELAAAVRVLAVTAESPVLPLFLRADAPTELRGMLYRAWQDVLADREQAEGLLTRLRIRGIEPVTDEELDIIAGYQRQAAETGYPELL